MAAAASLATATAWRLTSGAATSRRATLASRTASAASRRRTLKRSELVIGRRSSASTLRFPGMLGTRFEDRAGARVLFCFSRSEIVSSVLHAPPPHEKPSGVCSLNRKRLHQKPWGGVKDEQGIRQLITYPRE